MFDVKFYTCPYGNFGRINLTVDEEIDRDTLIPIQEILEEIPGYFTYRDVFNLIAIKPELFQGNINVEHFNPGIY